MLTERVPTNIFPIQVNVEFIDADELTEKDLENLISRPFAEVLRDGLTQVLMLLT